MQMYTPQEAEAITGMDLVALQLCILEAKQHDSNFAAEMPDDIDSWEYYPQYVVDAALRSQGKQLPSSSSENLPANLPSTQQQGAGAMIADENTIAVFAEVIQQLGIQTIASRGIERAEIESAIEKTAYTQRKTQILASDLTTIKAEYEEVVKADPLRYHRQLGLPDPLTLQNDLATILQQANQLLKKSERHWNQVKG